MTYLEDAAAILRKALTYWEQTAIKNPDNMRAEILDARLRIAEGFARLAAVEHGTSPWPPSRPARDGAAVMTAVTLSWSDPEDARQFRAILEDYRRDGWMPDPSRDAFLELARTSEDGGDGSEGMSGDD